MKPESSNETLYPYIVSTPEESLLTPQIEDFQVQELSFPFPRMFILIGGGLLLSVIFALLSARPVHAAPSSSSTHVNISANLRPSSSPEVLKSKSSSSSGIHSVSPVRSFASHQLSPGTGGVLGSLNNPEVKMLYYKEPKLLPSKRKVLVKDPSFQPSFVPALPMPKPTNRSRIRASTKDNSQKKDLYEGNTSDPNLLKYHTQLLVNAICHAMYYEVAYQGGKQFPYIVLALPKLLPILREHAIEGFQALPLDLQEKFANAITKVVPDLSNIESGVNMYEKFTNQKQETKMNLTERFKERQSVCHNKIENDPILKDEVLTAQGNDFADFVSGGEGTILLSVVTGKVFCIRFKMLRLLLVIWLIGI